jgi:tryptophanyl-tRNA synthetase
MREGAAKAREHASRTLAAVNTAVGFVAP